MAMSLSINDIKKDV